MTGHRRSFLLYNAKRSFRNISAQPKYITPPYGGISLAAGEYNIFAQQKYITAAKGGSAAGEYNIFAQQKYFTAAKGGSAAGGHHSARMRPISTPITLAIIRPRVQPLESPRQCSPCTLVFMPASILMRLE